MTKRKQMRRLAWIMTAALAAISLAGCGKEENPSQTSAAGGNNGGSSISVSEAPYPATFEPSGSKADIYTANMETFQREFIEYFKESGQADRVAGYDEPVSVTMVRPYSSGLQAIIDSLQSQYGESYEENRFTDIMKRLLNVDIYYNWVTGQSEYAQKLRFDMAANELPDIFFVTSQNDLAELAEADLIWDLDSMVEQYASDDLKMILDSQQYAVQKGMIDGRLYGLPSTMSATDNVRYLYIREDWMENLGLEYPKTLDELAEIIEAFATRDPDGNGVDDTYGLSGLSDYTYCFGAIFQGFGSNPKQIYEVEKGQNVYGGTTEGTKKALAYLADLYQKGYIQADFATQSAAQEREVIAQGKVGIVMGNHAIPTYMINTLHEIDPSVSWRAIVAPTETGEQNRILLSSSINGFIVVNKEFEHPEIAIKMANIVVSALYNSSVGDWWYYDQNASYSLSPFNVFMPAFSNLDTYLELQKAFEADDPSALSAKGQSYWKIMHGDNETSKWAYNSMFGPGEGTSMSVLNTYYQAGDYYWVTFNGQYNDQMNATYSSIGSAMNQIFISIITGQVDLETGWSQWMDTFTKLKGYEILDYVNQWCEENNSYN